MIALFDLDQTIINSAIANNERYSGNWKNVYDLIPQMEPYEKIILLIKKLIKDGHAVAIVTSSPESYTKRILEYLNINLYDVTLVCYHDTTKHKPDPEPINLAINKIIGHGEESVYYIGDDEKDIEAANRADCFSILGCWGRSYSYSYDDDLHRPGIICRNEDSLWRYFSLLGEISGKITFENRSRNIFQLCDYYPKSKIHDDISIALLNEFKLNKDNGFCEEFCEVFMDLDIPPNCFGVFVVPSSTPNKWNRKIMKEIIPNIVKQKKLIDCSDYIQRHTLHEKQAYGGNRSVVSNLDTIKLQYDLPDELIGAYIIDDITSTGNIFNACVQLLSDAGINIDNIRCIAIGGTQNV